MPGLRKSQIFFVEKTGGITDRHTVKGFPFLYNPCVFFIQIPEEKDDERCCTGALSAAAPEVKNISPVQVLQA